MRSRMKREEAIARSERCKERGKHEIPCDNCTDELKIQSDIDSRK